ncbi:FGGY-family carbohydrate kinase [Homoserinibacter gongjuensis]|uniref:ATPase n=1 Tax=Homoserinibacter gongjuensis TaxID=1162968 RepID=A0ABQ6JPU4_9MICO|nr:FGGY-family carbohydrate kinase [Homoserinibacter gongjuensis]GMA89767.1 ATPase [Homoserinibacter gongjuensis]
MSETTSLGIELGSTRIKACLIDADGRTLATGSHSWENQLEDGRWTYSLEAVHAGLRAAYANLVAELGAPPSSFGAIGVSAMMHGYLAFDADDELLVPFRTWRNTSTAAAATELSDALGVNIPLRWSIAHLHQAVLDDEPHVPLIARITTLAGYVHRLLTGRDCLGVGDASGMFPIDPATGDYDTRLIDLAQERLAAAGAEYDLLELLPPVLTAGADAGTLTAAGAALLDPSGTLQPGIPFAPPEGDAGTGMVATNAVRARTANVSAGTSIFAMVVLEGALPTPSPDIDVVTTPDGSPVAMVHCNNGSSELGAWVGVFAEFAAAIGARPSSDEVFAAVLGGALEPDAVENGLLAYNLLSGEPIVGTDEGRPLIVRTPGSRLSLAGFARAQLFSVFAALAIGMRELAAQQVAVDAVVAHGGLFRTGGVAQRALAAALATPVAVGESASEGGAWGIALLASYRRAVAEGETRALPDWLDATVFAAAPVTTIAPTASDIAGYAGYLERWEAGLAVERAAIAALTDIAGTDTAGTEEAGS